MITIFLRLCRAWYVQLRQLLYPGEDFDRTLIALFLGSPGAAGSGRPSVTGFKAGKHALCRPFSQKIVRAQKKPSFEWTILSNQLPKTQISSTKWIATVQARSQFPSHVNISNQELPRNVAPEGRMRPRSSTGSQLKFESDSDFNDLIGRDVVISCSFLALRDMMSNSLLRQGLIHDLVPSTDGPGNTLFTKLSVRFIYVLIRYYYIPR